MLLIAQFLIKDENITGLVVSGKIAECRDKNINTVCGVQGANYLANFFKECYGCRKESLLELCRKSTSGRSGKGILPRRNRINANCNNPQETSNFIDICEKTYRKYCRELPQ